MHAHCRIICIIISVKLIIFNRKGVSARKEPCGLGYVCTIASYFRPKVFTVINKRVDRRGTTIYAYAHVLREFQVPLTIR